MIKYLLDEFSYLSDSVVSFLVEVGRRGRGKKEMGVGRWNVVEM